MFVCVFVRLRFKVTVQGPIMFVSNVQGRVFVSRAEVGVEVRVEAVTRLTSLILSGAGRSGSGERLVS